jgi:GT2 family glycosyltransferase
VILPVYNATGTVETVLRALRCSDFQDFELIVVDDGSRDGSAAIVERWKPDLLLRNETNQGHTAARNRGAACARGDVLFFTDADVLVGHDTLERVAAWFQDPAVECLVGLYQPLEPHEHLASAYKNAWIHHSYARSPDAIDWFFTAVGAVRRETFEREGGFDRSFRREGGGGDVEFGRRLRASGVRIHLDKSMRVTHLRRFTVGSLLRNDYRRASGWTRLALGSAGGLRAAATRGVANVSRAFAASSALALLACVALLLTAGGRVGLAALGFAFALQLVLDRGFLAFARRLFGIRRAAAFALLGFLDRVACGAGMVAGMAATARSPLPEPEPTLPLRSSADDR